MQQPRPRHIGQVVAGEYLIDKAIGFGAFAIVYRATSRKGKHVAVKILNHDSGTPYKRFAREVAVLKAIPPNLHVAGYVAHGQTQRGEPFLVMDYVDGITMREGMRRCPRLPPDKVAAIISEVCVALGPLHQLGVAHCDLKPDNILLSRDGVIKLIDFGLVRDTEGILTLLEHEQGPILHHRVFAEELDYGVIAGTLPYMAPEQFADGMLENPAQWMTGTHSDIFSLGVIFCELLTGDRPFVQQPDQDIWAYADWRIQLPDSEGPPLPAVLKELERIIRRAMRNDASRRQPSGRVLRDELVSYLVHRRGAEHGAERTREVPAKSANELPYLPMDTGAIALPDQDTELTPRKWPGEGDLRFRGSTSIFFDGNDSTAVGGLPPEVLAIHEEQTGPVRLPNGPSVHGDKTAPVAPQKWPQGAVTSSDRPRRFDEDTQEIPVQSGPKNDPLPIIGDDDFDDEKTARWPRK